MSELIAIAYDDLYRAEEVRLTLLRRKHLVELEDAAVVIKDPKGNVRLSQAFNLTGMGAVSGGFWGLLIGALLLMPWEGAAIGAAAGALGGALTDIGVNDEFMRELGETLRPGTSALFILVRKFNPDRLLAEIAPYGGRVLRTSLTKDQEAELQEVLTNRGLLPQGPST